jgi:outer membrane protein assembly factor BamE
MLMNRISPFLLLLTLSACSNTSGFVTAVNPFRIDVRQGNYVTQEMVAQLKPGQTRDQVRFILGTPLLTNIFHAERWDYVYRFQPGSGDEVQQRHLAVFFQNNLLTRVAGDVAAIDPKSLQDKPVVRSVEIQNPVAKPAPVLPETTQ